jgi:D-alanine-D-alanine ligase
MKENTASEKDMLPTASFPLKDIGVIYCTSSCSAEGREIEFLADCELGEVASAVRGALRGMGYSVDLIDLNPDQMVDLKKYSWIFNLTETIFGFPLADFEIAEKMERFNINFTGSGSQALKACENKAITKSELIRHGIITPAYKVIEPGQPIEFLAVSFPVIVKPVHEDGNIGISNHSIAWNQAEVAARANYIHHYYHQAALVEEYIDGRDITSSILGNGENAIVLPLSEIIYPEHSQQKFLTYDAKWVPESPDYRVSPVQCPAQIDPEMENLITEVSLKCYKIMGCRDYARVDFRLRERTPYVLEVNPNPCINPDNAGFVVSAQAAGFPYSKVIEKILEASVSNICTAPNELCNEGNRWE